MADEVNRVPEPAALLGREVWEKGEEVGLVAAAELARLEEEQDFGGDSGEAPRRLLNGVPYRDAYARLAVQKPLMTGTVAKLDVEVEALLWRKVDAIGERLADVEAAVDVDRQVEAPAVPERICIAGDAGCVRNELPAVEVLEEGPLVLDEDDDIDVSVLAGESA